MANPSGEIFWSINICVIYFLQSSFDFAALVVSGLLKTLIAFGKIKPKSRILDLIN